MASWELQLPGEVRQPLRPQIASRFTVGCSSSSALLPCSQRGAGRGDGDPEISRGTPPPRTHWCPSKGTCTHTSPCPAPPLTLTHAILGEHPALEGWLRAGEGGIREDVIREDSGIWCFWLHHLSLRVSGGHQPPLWRGAWGPAGARCSGCCSRRILVRDSGSFRRLRALTQQGWPVAPLSFPQLLGVSRSPHLGPRLCSRLRPVPGPCTRISGILGKPSQVPPPEHYTGKGPGSPGFSPPFPSLPGHCRGSDWATGENRAEAVSVPRPGEQQRAIPWGNRGSRGSVRCN